MLIQRMLGGKLNTDASPYSIPRGDYSWAQNITVSQRDGTGQPINGTNKVNFSLPAGQNKVIGKVAQPVKNRVFYFVWNSNGTHTILMYNNANRTITKVLQSKTDSGGVDILKFNKDKKIVNADIITRDGEGDILSWTDGNESPKEMIIDKVMSGAYGVMLEEYIEAGRRPPLGCPTNEYKNVAGRQVNSLRRKLFQFKFRYEYDDYSKSVWSPAGKVPYPKLVWADNVQDLDPSINNCIDVTITSGSKRVTKIELAARECVGTTWSDYFLVSSLDKADLGIGHEATYTFNFFNDAAYPFIDVRESNHLFDYMPRRANAQGLANGNTKVYGGILEGYDRIADSQMSMSASITMTENKSDAAYAGPPALTWTGGSDPFGNNDGQLVVGATIVPGTVYRVFWRDSQTSPVTTFMEYTSVPGDTQASVAQALAALQPSYAVYVSGGQINIILLTGHQLFYTNVIEPPVGSISEGWENIWNWSSRYRFGVVYFDEQGRTNGVHIDKVGSDVLTPTYEMGPTAAKVPVITLTISHRPPSWARKYQVVRSRNLTKEFFLMWKSASATSDTEYYYFDIDSLYKKRADTPGYVPNYEFLEGDRVRVIINNIGPIQTYPTVDFIVSGVVEREVSGAKKKFLKVLRPSGYPDFAGSQLLEIWRPAQAGGNAADEVYYEFGEVFDVYSDSGTPCHRGSVSDQSNFAGSSAVVRMKFGDVYYRLRDSLWVSDMHYSDNFKSSVNSNGRPQALDYTQKEVFYPTLVRFSLEFQNATSVNQINRFYFDNLDEYDRKYGAVMAFTMRDSIMRVFQQLKVGSVPVYQRVLQDITGNAVVAQSDKLLNNIRYYNGDFGVGSNPESIASSLLSDYFCDPVSGVVCRVSLDGINPLSIQHDNNDLFVGSLVNRNGEIFGGFYAGEENEYIISMPAVGSKPALTVTFDESHNGFETTYGFYPEQMVCLGTLMILFKDGELWTWDNITTKCNIFGTQLKPYIKLTFNDSPTFKKTFIGITETTGEVWEAVDINTSLGQTSNLISADFRKLEDGYHATFLRAQNSPGGLSSGDTLKGNWVEVGLSPVSGQSETLFVSASVKFIISNQNSR